MTTTNKQEYDWLVKIIILGDSGVGKTNILQRFCENRFAATHNPTIGVDFKIKTLIIDGKKIKLQIWDTAGQERFRTITKSYYKGAYAVILSYSITDRESFEHVQSWINSITENNKDEIIKVLIGNKCDDIQCRKVDIREGRQIANQFNMPFMEVSAKDDINITEIFHELGRLIKDKLVKEEEIEFRLKEEEKGRALAADTEKQNTKKCCGSE